MDVLNFPGGEKVPPEPIDKPEFEFAGMKFRFKQGSLSDWEYWNNYDDKAEWIPVEFLTIEGFRIDILLNLMKTAKPVVQAAEQVNGMFRHNPKMRDLHAATDEFTEMWKEWDHNWLRMEND